MWKNRQREREKVPNLIWYTKRGADRTLRRINSLC